MTSWDFVFSVQVRTLGRRPNAAVHEKDQGSDKNDLCLIAAAGVNCGQQKFPSGGRGMTTNDHNPTVVLQRHLS